MRLLWSLIAPLALTASALVWPIDAGWPARLMLGWDADVLLFLTASLWRVPSIWR